MNRIDRIPEDQINKFAYYATEAKPCENDYYFDLTERQAKNIYLNMLEEGYVKRKV